MQIPPLKSPMYCKNNSIYPRAVSLAGFLGRFMEQKGFLVLVEAMDQLFSKKQDLPFHLLAVGSGDFIREYRTAVNKRPLITPHITFMEAVPDVLPILQELDLLIMPSLWEACPVLPMEAMCAGVPVLGSDCIGLREVLRGTPSLTSPAGDAPALASAIQEAIKPGSRHQAQAYVAEACVRFDNRPAAGRLRQVYEAATRSTTRH